MIFHVMEKILGIGLVGEITVSLAPKLLNSILNKA